MARPECPEGHRGTVYLDGYYGRSINYRRPSYRCVPKEGRRHRFQAALARRQPGPDHPAGDICGECERTLDRDEGPETARKAEFTIREAARVLVRVGEGRSLREASEEARRGAGWSTRSARGHLRPSKHGQLAADYVGAYGPVVRDHYLPPAWPTVLLLDEQPFSRVKHGADGYPTRGHLPDFSLLAVYGYPDGPGSGQLWRLAVAPGSSRVEWEEFLRSLPALEPPSWVVTDQGQAAANAARAVWPGVRTYVCEGHLARTGAEKLKADGIGPTHALWPLWIKSFVNLPAWEAFRAGIADARAEKTHKWILDRDALITRQMTMRQRGLPRGTGALEAHLVSIEAMVGERHHVFRNHSRLQLIVDLMTIERRRQADTSAYARLIRSHLLAHGGRAQQARRSLAEQASSLRAMTAALLEERGAARAHAAAGNTHWELANTIENNECQGFVLDPTATLATTPAKRRKRPEFYPQ